MDAVRHSDVLLDQSPWSSFGFGRRFGILNYNASPVRAQEDRLSGVNMKSQLQRGHQL